MNFYKSAEQYYAEMTSTMNDVDVSKNSLIYNSLMPCAFELSYQSQMLDEAVKMVFASTAVASGYDNYVILRCAELGIIRKSAETASGVIKVTGVAGYTLPQGALVSTSLGLTYITDSALTLTSTTGYINITATAEGSSYNADIGEINIIPVKYEGISSVINESEIDNGYDIESISDLYQRYLLKIQTPATSGNIHQYEEWCLSVEGVGAVKVYPLKDENLQSKNGNVTCVITDSNKQGADTDLINKVKQYICPDNGEGEGQAPIGATVNIISVQEVPLNITVDVQIDTTTTLTAVQTTLTKSIETYLKTATFSTKKVNLVRIGSLLLDISGVVDYSNLKINGSESNLPLSEIQVAVMGTVSLGVIA